MSTVLYTFDRRFMRKTFEAIDRHVPVSSAYLPLRPAAVGSSDRIREIPLPEGAFDHEDGSDVDGSESGSAPGDDVADETVERLDDAVRAVEPDVVVQNHRFEPDRLAHTAEYPLVHVRHGASVGRGEVRNTTGDLGDVVDRALAPGERWAAHYRRQFPDDVAVAVVGIPEADPLVGTDPPDDRRVLYAPTNHNYGGGCYVETAEAVLDVFEGSEYELLFRPHPMDRREEPGRSLTRRCRDRIADMPNVRFDDDGTPRSSLRAADLLISDCSGIVTEWLHADRPLLQLTDIAGDATVPPLGYRIDRPSLALVERLYESGYPPAVRRRCEDYIDALGVPMDGRAGERAAAEVMACTP